MVTVTKPAKKKAAKKQVKKKAKAPAAEKPPRPKRDRQQHLPGTQDPVDAKTTAKAQEYVDYLTERMKLQKAEDVTRGELVELMHVHGMQLVRLDGHEVKLVHKDAVDKIRVKTLKDDDS